MKATHLVSAIALTLVLGGIPAEAQKFFPDDPLGQEPWLVPTVDPEPRALSEILELLSNTLGSPGERHPELGVIRAGGVNTLGEVMDGPWYVNRHGTERSGPGRMTREILLRGPGNRTPPSADAPWDVLVVKLSGLRPGILVVDRAKQMYLLRFDAPGHYGLATGAEVVSSKFFYALGYHVPENYIVEFGRRQLVASEAGEGISSAGASRDLLEVDIDEFLEHVARGPDGRYRAVATRVPAQWGGLLGPYQVYGVRSDDPNDIVPHEHRRDLRGLFVFCAWLNHNFMRAVNTLDVMVEENAVPRIRHYLVDFTSTLGSSGLRGAKRAWEGRETIYPGKAVLKNIVSFGIYTPAWMRARYPKDPAVGYFDAETFDPEKWTTNHPIAPFANRLPDDDFWAAKKVMAFTDEEIRAVVTTGEFPDPSTAETIARILIERRNRIGRTYFERVLPLDDFRVAGGRLELEDLALRYGFITHREIAVRWLTLDNETGRLTRLSGANGFELPAAVRATPVGSYVAARLDSGGDAEMNVTVFLRHQEEGFEVVGIDRGWPGKVLADPSKDEDTGVSRFADLAPEQQELFRGYAEQYNERTGRGVEPGNYFDSLTISERTTFEAITHALMRSALTDADGESLGTAFDRVKSIERIAGQYYGRSGDQQFRLYVFIEPGTREILEKSQEFHFGHENTVYHAGYPMSFRQNGKEPSIQFSMSEDGNRADIDVDYRSSKSPQALFNGHLTSANSDVRSGDNHERHNGRWGGLIAWWRDVFGSLEHEDRRNERDLLAASAQELPTPLPPDRPAGASIPDVQEAVQEFLSDWLVRRQYDEALDRLSSRAYACVNLDDDTEREALGEAGARDALRDIMHYSIKEMGELDNLTEAIDAVEPWDPSRVVLDHPYDSDFTLIEMPEEDAAQYLCGQNPDRPAGAVYYGVLFKFKRKGGAILGLLWSRENEEWRLVSYQAFEQ